MRVIYSGEGNGFLRRVRFFWKDWRGEGEYVIDYSVFCGRG